VIEPARRAVLVVGAGIAGTAAAISAARAGARVTAIDGGTGASLLATGALDFVPWSEASTLPAEISLEARAVLHALGVYVLRESHVRLLTSAGVVRTARGHDAALIDVAPLGGRPVGVVRCRRPGWDADALAKQWGSAFVPIDAQVLRHADERVLPDADFAARHDDAARVGWLADRLREALARVTDSGAIAGLVLPSSLGVEHPCAEALSHRAGIPCGEAITLPGGASGLRFQRARDRAFAYGGILRIPGRVIRAARDDPGGGSSPSLWRVATEGGQTFEAHAVILAAGGLLGGGIEYESAASARGGGSRRVASGLAHLTLDAPLRLGAFGRPLESAGSLHWIPPESIAWPFVIDGALERAGALVGDDGSCLHAPRGLFAVGELVADAPRTWLHALASGARAGAAAVRAIDAGG
jgi:glycerol-3-phosphate dehydrogenase subunit B